MDILKEEQKRKEFRNILFDLADLQDLLQSSSERVSIYRRLEELYYVEESEEGFRHFYSDIFSVLSQIQQGDKPGSIDILGQNLMEIRRGYQLKNKDKDGETIDISDNIRKLYDHVSLDIARMGYSDAADRRLAQEETIGDIKGNVNKIQKELSTLQGEAVQIREDISKTKKQIDESEEKIKNTQKEYVTILGIFAAIVTTFTAGITFSTSVLSNIHKSSIYRLIFMTSLIGLILVNVLYGLYYYIDRIIRTNDSRKNWPLIVANATLIGLLIAVTIIWFLR